MAVTITRTAFTDDDGSGTTGTVINNAVKTELYGQIDTALALLLPLAGGTVTGLLTVSGFGGHNFSASGVGGNILRVTNFAAGTGNYAELSTLNDASSLAMIRNLSSTYTTSGFSIQNGALLYGDGAGGWSIVANNVAGAIRFYSGGTTLRGTWLSSGPLVLGTSTEPNPGGASSTGIGLDGINGLLSVGRSAGQALIIGRYTSTGTLVEFDYAAVTKGTISTDGATVAYNTTSDSRLKNDFGLATSVDVLRHTRVHDGSWKADGSFDRFIFAQEALAVKPRAVTQGTDELDANDQLLHPWMLDYPKYIPDLIVGWQQHDAAILALTARVEKLEMTHGWLDVQFA